MEAAAVVAGLQSDAAHGLTPAEAAARFGSLTAVTTLSAFAYELWVDGNLEDARNAAFSVLVIAELLRSFGARSDTRTIWEVGLLSNIRLFVIVAASFSLQLVIHHEPNLAAIFRTEPISLGQCLAWILLGAVPLLALEARKVVLRSRQIGNEPFTEDAGT